MLEHFTTIASQFGISETHLLIAGFGLGSMLIFFGFVSVFSGQNPAATRIAATPSNRRQARQDRALLRPDSSDPRGIMKSIIPADLAKRTALQLQLAQAGYSGPGALANFTLVRLFLGLILPGILLALVFLGKTPGVTLPLGISEKVSQLSSLQIFQALSILVAAGYTLPLMWLRGRVSERHRRIEEAFPNALDLVQISVEAGLGFDAAMTRVGNELAEVSPDIAFEFLSVQRQVQAGRARDAAMLDMAVRTGVETVRSFANVVVQSMQFGTPMSEALTTYAQEMRLYREMRAQEMANKLPVKMSAVLASLMLPALILLTVGPVVIRYTRYFAG